MVAEGVDEVAIETFAHYYRLLEHGETGMIPESSIEPIDMESLADVEVSDDVAADAVRKTAVIKLNGGLGTSMGMERAKSLLCVRRGLSFLDIIARQVLHLRTQYDATLPLLFMNSFRTSADTMEALARYEDLPVDGLPLEFLQNKEPKLLEADLMPAAYPKDPDLEWCPPGHGDIYTALRGTGLLAQLIDAGYRYVFVSNSDNLGAVLVADLDLAERGHVDRVDARLGDHPGLAVLEEPVVVRERVDRDLVHTGRAHLPAREREALGVALACHGSIVG